MTFKAWSTQEFFCDKYIDRVDGRATICQLFKVYCASDDWTLDSRYTQKQGGAALPPPSPPQKKYSAHEHIHPLCDESSIRTTFRKWPLKPNTSDHIKIGQFSTSKICHKNCLCRSLMLREHSVSLFEHFRHFNEIKSFLKTPKQ